MKAPLDFQRLSPAFPQKRNPTVSDTKSSKHAGLLDFFFLSQLFYKCFFKVKYARFALELGFFALELARLLALFGFESYSASSLSSYALIHFFQSHLHLVKTSLFPSPQQRIFLMYSPNDHRYLP